MFKKILFPTDFSDVAQKAMTYIKQLKDSGAEEVVVLHVIDERGMESLHRIMGEDKIEALIKLRNEETRKDLKGVAEELKAAGLRVTVRLESGIPVREILKVEQEGNFSVIVIGSHGLSNLQEIFMGSVSEKVVRKCLTPVFIIKR